MNIHLASDLTGRTSSFLCMHPFLLPYLTTYSVLANPAATRIQILARPQLIHKELGTTLFCPLSYQA